MNKEQLAKEIYKISHLSGNFTLRSGKVSNEYFDKYLFESEPQLLKEIVEHLTPLIPKETEILAGLELGGVPIATALSLKSGIPAVFVRKKHKEYGTKKLAEGVEISGKNVCVVEDVTTTGGQIIDSANELRKLHAKVSNVLCVIIRDDSAGDNLRKANLSLYYLYKMKDLS